MIFLEYNVFEVEVLERFKTDLELTKQDTCYNISTHFDIVTTILNII